MDWYVYVIFILFFALVYMVCVYLFDNKGRDNYNSSTPPNTTPKKTHKNISVLYSDEWGVYETKPLSREELMIDEFWSKAHNIARNYIQNNELDLLNEFVYNVWSTRDKEESALELHYFLSGIIFYFYSKKTPNLK